MVSEFFTIFKTKPNILQSELKSTLNSPDEILEVNKYLYASTYLLGIPLHNTLPRKALNRNPLKKISKSYFHYYELL